MENEKIFTPENMVFLSENGLTSTSANHLANKAKESIKDLEAKLANIRFYNTNMMLMSNPGEVVEYEKGMSFEDINKVDEYLGDIAKTNALIAWLREAIKAKKNLDDNVNGYTEGNFANDNNIEVPRLTTDNKHMKEEDVIATWDINKRNKYFTLEAICSTYGKAIHPKGAFYEAKQKLNDIVNNPAKVDGNGRDCIVYKYKESVNQKDVQETWDKLNDYLRSKEAQLNSMKYEIENTIRENNIKVDTEFKKAYDEFCSKQRVFHLDYEEYKTKCKNYISTLKIVIPDDLMDIYEKVK